MLVSLSEVKNRKTNRYFSIVHMIYQCATCAACRARRGPLKKNKLKSTREREREKKCAWYKSQQRRILFKDPSAGGKLFLAYIRCSLMDCSFCDFASIFPKYNFFC